MHKEFGKLTGSQLRQLISWLPQLDSMRDEIRQAVKAKPQNFERIAPNGLRWASTYELPFEEHLARLALAVGMEQFIVDAGKAADPQQTVLDAVAEGSPGVVPELPEDMKAVRHTFCLLYAVLNSFECLMVYGQYLNELIAIGRRGDAEGDEALLNAIRIDPTIVSGPTVSARLSRASIFGDEVFLKGVRLALEGRTGDQVTYLRKFRFAVKVLSESDGLTLSNKQLAIRLIELGIYISGPSDVKNAAELIRKSKKKHAI